MISKDELQEMRELAAFPPSTNPLKTIMTLSQNVITLLDELERVRKQVASAEAWRAKENVGRCYDGG